MNNKNRINCDKMNLINGKLIESKNDFENLKKFINRWECKIKEIKKIILDNNQALNIAQDFINETYIKFMYEDSLKDKTTLLDQIGHDLFLVLFEANNNYRKQFPSFWQTFHKLKLPDLHYHKNG